MKKDKLEVMIVDDDEENCINLFLMRLNSKGYDVKYFSDSYDAIKDISIRMARQEELPDIYLCDLQDRANYYNLAYIKSQRSGEMTPINLVIAINIHNFFTSQQINPAYFIAMSGAFSEEDEAISEEDEAISERYNIPLVAKFDVRNLFPDISNLSLDEARKAFRENWEKQKGENGK